jgi:serine/threonine protein kinase
LHFNGYKFSTDRVKSDIHQLVLAVEAWDIKPANVYLAKESNLVLRDFGFTLPCRLTRSPSMSDAFFPGTFGGRHGLHRRGIGRPPRSTSALPNGLRVEAATFRKWRGRSVRRRPGPPLRLRFRQGRIPRPRPVLSRRSRLKSSVSLGVARRRRRWRGGACAHTGQISVLV